MNLKQHLPESEARGEAMLRGEFQPMRFVFYTECHRVIGPFATTKPDFISSCNFYDMRGPPGAAAPPCLLPAGVRGKHTVSFQRITFYFFSRSAANELQE